jgi:hypothetical protein
MSALRSFSPFGNHMSAQCVVGTALPFKVMVTKLIESECHITTNERALSIGQSVLVRFEGMEGLRGTVIWALGVRYAIKFDRPIHGAVLDHLIARMNGTATAPKAPSAPPARRMMSL